MKLPSDLANKNEWVLLGPMGPHIPDYLLPHPVICVDGGANFIKRSDIWVGDKDSFDGEISSNHSFHFSANKDKSDLSLAFELLNLNFPLTLHLWGFIGGRRDHEMFNLGEALSFLDHHIDSQIKFYNESGKILFHLISKGIWNFNHHGIFSLGSLKVVELKITGNCDYPIHQYKAILPFSSFGLSNVAQGEVKIDTTGPLFIYYPEEI